MMKVYKVSFWFGIDAGKSESNRVVYIQTDKTEKREIVALALKDVGTYPRTYEVKVEETDKTLHEYMVIKIINSEEAHPKSWYHSRDDEMFVVYLSSNGKYVTCQYLGDSSTVGEIPPYYCKVITTFKEEDNY